MTCVDLSCNRLCDYFFGGRQARRSQPVWRAGGGGPLSQVPRLLLASPPARRRPILLVGTDAPRVGARARAAPCRAFAPPAPARRGLSPRPRGEGWLLLSPPLAAAPLRNGRAAAALFARLRRSCAAARAAARRSTVRGRRLRRRDPPRPLEDRLRWGLAAADAKPAASSSSRVPDPSTLSAQLYITPRDTAPFSFLRRD